MPPPTDLPVPDRTRPRSAGLARPLALTLLLKALLLVALWVLFVRDARVPVDADKAATHLLPARPATSQAATDDS